MTQSRLHSFFETSVSTAIGFFVSLVLQMIVNKTYHQNMSFVQDFSIVIIFTVASLIRGYLVRRFFNHKLNSGK